MELAWEDGVDEEDVEGLGAGSWNVLEVLAVSKKQWDCLAYLVRALLHLLEAMSRAENFQFSLQFMARHSTAPHSLSNYWPNAKPQPDPSESNFADISRMLGSDLHCT